MKAIARVKVGIFIACNLDGAWFDLFASVLPLIYS